MKATISPDIVVRGVDARCVKTPGHVYFLTGAGEKIPHETTNYLADGGLYRMELRRHRDGIGLARWHVAGQYGREGDLHPAGASWPIDDPA